ncbi:MAG: hypothetical protein RIS64_642 [Bacteroidota bacterium]|jgi:O-antigen/teichoic acid export membrane protein
MSILKKLAGQTAVYGLSSILGRFLNYLLVPLYTGIFQPGAYGVSAWFYAFASFGGVMFTYGMETAFFRYVQKSDDQQKVASTAMISLTISALVMGSLIFVLAHPLANWSQNAGRETYFRFFALILAADAIVTIPFAWLRQQNEAMRFATIRLLSIGLNIGLNLFFYLLCPYLLNHGHQWVANIYNREVGIGYMFIANALSSVLILPFFVKEFELMKNGFDAELWKKMFNYALPLIFMGFAGMINETLDRMLLKHLIVDQSVAEYQTGIYSANYKLSILITLFIQAFRMGAEPFFFAKAKDDDARETYARVMQFFVFVCLTMFLVVMLYLDIFKYLIRKKAYWDGLNVVPILLAANICLGVYYNLSVWYKLTDKTRLGALVSIVGVAITLILNWLWIPTMGYVGSAWATLICYFAMAAVSYFLGHRYYPVPYPVQKIGIYALMAFGIYVLSDWLHPAITSPFTWQKALTNSVLLFSYIFLIYKMEEKDIKQLLS